MFEAFFEGFEVNRIIFDAKRGSKGGFGTRRDGAKIDIMIARRSKILHKNANRHKLVCDFDLLLKSNARWAYLQQFWRRHVQSVS